MLRILFVTVLLLASTRSAHADSNTAAHVAASAGITAGLYLVMSAFTGREKKSRKESLLGAAAFAIAAGVAKESMDSMNRGDKRLDKSDLGANLAGVAGASLGIMAFDF